MVSTRSTWFLVIVLPLVVTNLLLLREIRQIRADLIPNPT